MQVFKHSEDGYNCTRIPTVILADDVLLAVAEGRKWVGDGCVPHGSAVRQGESHTAALGLPPRGLLAPDQPYTDVVAKHSTVSAHGLPFPPGSRAIDRPHCLPPPGHPLPSLSVGYILQFSAAAVVLQDGGKTWSARAV
eukprot:SAG31_NODE_14335_length_813_cov_0.851541_1_plen_138_part_10